MVKGAVRHRTCDPSAGGCVSGSWRVMACLSHTVCHRNSCNTVVFALVFLGGFFIYE